MALTPTARQRALVALALLAAPGLGGCGVAAGVAPVLRAPGPGQLPIQSSLSRPSAQVAIASPAGARAVFLTVGGAQAPVYSPQGQSLAYESKGQIVLAHSDGSQPRPLAEGSAPAFSPDGHAIAFMRHGATGDAIMRFDLGNGMTQTLYDSPEALSGFTWTPASDGFVLATAAGLSRLSLGHGAPATLWAGQGVSHPVLSADGRFVLFDALHGEQGSQLARLPLAGGAPQFLSVNAPHPRQASLSPSGRSLAFIADDGLYVANADGTAPLRLAPGQGFSNPDWNPKQPQILLSAPHGALSDLQAIALPSR